MRIESHRTLPKISVIMSVHNGEKYLGDSIVSILNQTFDNFEFLIMDDASNDNSKEILHYFSEKDNRIKIFSNKTCLGLPFSLNRLIENSRGEFFARMDADDISMNNRLELQYNFMKMNPKIGVLASGANLIDIDDNFICKKYLPSNMNTIIQSMPYFNYITHPSVMISKYVFKKFGFYNEKYRSGQDWELWTRYIDLGVEFGLIEDILLCYRITPGSISSWQSKSKAGSYLNLALKCLHNNSRSDSYKYLNHLPYKYKIKYFFHWLLPFKLFQLINKYYQLYYPQSPMCILKNQA